MIALMFGYLWNDVMRIHLRDELFCLEALLFDVSLFLLGFSAEVFFLHHYYSDYGVNKSNKNDRERVIFNRDKE